MRTALPCLATLVAMALVGCADRALDTGPVQRFREANGLKVQIELAGRYLKTGDSLRVSVTATNTTGKPIVIQSPSGAPVLVRVLRHTGLNREQVRYYPGSATPNILAWTLPARQSRTFVLMVPVEPDWPAEEILHVSAELNGYSHIAPTVAVIIQAPRKD